MGNVAVTIVSRGIKGAKKEVVADFKFSTSYATNGDTLLANDIDQLLGEVVGSGKGDLTKVTQADFEVGSDGTSIFLDRVAKKLKAMNGRAEVANATNLNVTPGNIRGTIEYGQVTG